MIEKYDWMDSAKCAVPEVGYHDYSYPSARRAKNHLPVLEKFISKYCNSCPVKAECKDSASPEDLSVTVRGGMIPTGKLNLSNTPLISDAELLERKNRNSEASLAAMDKLISKGACRNGHQYNSRDDVTLSTSHTRRNGRKVFYYTPVCATCKSESRKAERLRRKARDAMMAS